MRVGTIAFSSGKSESAEAVVLVDSLPCARGVYML